jgi:hypothetical protein
MFTSGELSGFRATHSYLMNDECQILDHGVSYNALNEPIDVYTTGSAISCGFDPSGGAFRRGVKFPTREYDAKVRLEYDTVFDEKSLVMVTKRFDIDITPIIYEIMDIQFGVAGYNVGLKKWQE